jgi:hypothetical protein
MAVLAKGRKLRPGTYLLTLTALDASGRAVSDARAKFWVIAR